MRSSCISLPINGNSRTDLDRPGVGMSISRSETFRNIKSFSNWYLNLSLEALYQIHHWVVSVPPLLIQFLRICVYFFHFSRNIKSFSNWYLNLSLEALYQIHHWVVSMPSLLIQFLRIRVYFFISAQRSVASRGRLTTMTNLQISSFQTFR